MICCECGHEMRLTSEPMRETYKGDDLVVDGIERWECGECGNYVVSLDQADRLSRALADAYAAKHRLLSPEEIREARTGLGLTQKEFEAMLGVSSPSASRWESGKVTQSKPVDLLVRVARDVIGAAEFLMDEAGLRVASARVSSGMRRPGALTGGWATGAEREGRVASSALRADEWKMAA